MLDECHQELDVVLIATPDHHHAPAAIRAINYGKHVFCQKPLAHNIGECYALAKAAREKKVLTAMALTGHLAQYAGIGGKIEWDAEKMECTNKPELNKFIRREYRSGWEV